MKIFGKKYLFDDQKTSIIKTASKNKKSVNHPTTKKQIV